MISPVKHNEERSQALASRGLPIQKGAEYPTHSAPYTEKEP